MSLQETARQAGTRVLTHARVRGLGRAVAEPEGPRTSLGGHHGTPRGCGHVPLQCLRPPPCQEVSPTPLPFLTWPRFACAATTLAPCCTPLGIGGPPTLTLATPSRLVSAREGFIAALLFEKRIAQRQRNLAEIFRTDDWDGSLVMVPT